MPKHNKTSLRSTTKAKAKSKGMSPRKPRRKSR